jgi:prepilin-type N-terminal cleavage/methylation domain-containing protein
MGFSGYFHKSIKKGFTLLEILVVIGILTVMFSIVLVSLNIPRQFMLAHDVKRKNDILTLHKAFTFYYTEHHNLPTNSQWSGILCNNSVPDFLKPYMSYFPCDPATNEKYFYEPLDSSCQQCFDGVNTCAGYRIMAKLENTEDKAILQVGCDPINGCGVKSSRGNPFNYGISQNCIVKNQDPIWKTSQESIKQNEIPAASKILEINLSYDTGNVVPITISSVNIKNGYPQNIYPSKNSKYSLVLYDNNNSIITSSAFEIPAGYTDSLTNGVATGSAIILNQMNFSLTLPWNDSARNLKITDNTGQVVNSFDLSQAKDINNKQQFFSVIGNDIFPETSNNKINLNSIVGKAYASSNKGYANITFIGDGFVNSSDLAIFHSNMNFYITHLMAIEPFKSRAANISFHYIDNT